MEISAKSSCDSSVTNVSCEVVPTRLTPGGRICHESRRLGAPKNSKRTITRLIQSTGVDLHWLIVCASVLISVQALSAAL